MLITLKQWDAKNFAKQHSTQTLQGWARNGKIQPPPTKVGKEWLVEDCAKYVNNSTQIKIMNKAREFVNQAPVSHNHVVDDTVLRILNGA